MYQLVKISIRSVGVIVCLLICSSVYADENSYDNGSIPEAKFIFGAGITLGGDRLSEATYMDGSTASVKAGGFYEFWAGILYEVPDYPMEAQVTLGYHSDSESASNGSMSFSRLPLEGLVFYTHDVVRIGGGLTYHLSPEHEMSLDGYTSYNTSFESALGLVFQVDFNLSDQNYGPKNVVGFRYVSIDYEADSVNGTPVTGSVDGSHFGFIYQYAF